MDPFIALGLAGLGLLLILQILVLRRPVPLPPDLSGVNNRLDQAQRAIQQTEAGLRDEFSRLRQEFALSAKAQSEGLEQRLNSFSATTGQRLEALQKAVADSGGHLQTQIGDELERLRATQQTKMDEIRATVETRLMAMSADNERRLGEMRQTVEEKLQGTLEARLGESFKQVSERLEQVHQGLGEMKTLANGVGDLRQLLTNVKVRGTWGEVQLGNLLEQMLTVDQFAKNVATTGTAERVEFAIRLPGHQEGESCWLPVDAKFPLADYQRIQEASQAGDQLAVEAATAALEKTIRLNARSIKEKYISPPHTTDFGILFLPTEGLYAEALRRPGLLEALQLEHRVIVTGPSTFAAILNSLQMGFNTLKIQRHSSEVWKALGLVKTEFGKYATVLGQVKKKLGEATNKVEEAERQTQRLERQLIQAESGVPPEPEPVPGQFDFVTEFEAQAKGAPLLGLGDRD